MFFLLRFVKDDKVIQSFLKKLVRDFQKPIDEKDLQILIIEGLVPDIKSILNYIKQRV